MAAGRTIVTTFQLDIYRTPLRPAGCSGCGGRDGGDALGEETIFRGFLFRGWLRAPRDVWPVIIGTSLFWAFIHVQYDWYAIAQVFVFGVLLGWLRCVTGSTILTMVLHAMINCEGMLETFISLHK